MMNRALTAVSLLAVLTGTASAQKSKAQDDADLKEIHSYTLTMPVLQKMAAAARAAATAIQNDPRYRDDEAREKAMDASGESDANATLSDMERTIAKIPHMSEALKSVGLSPREYAKFSMCAFEAGMVAGMQKNGVAIKLPEGVQPANVQFMKDHEKDFAALQTAMQPGK